MKTKLHFIVLGIAAGLNLGSGNAHAHFEVSASFSIHAAADFYVPLQADGVWIDVGSYGRCWRPAHVAVGWRPYCYGHWIWTDCGWYWESDEPWAWACYHYGSWVIDPVEGWVWVPGIEWAPAWVSWRVGAGYVGWAPLGPRGVVVAGPHFVFVTAGRFTEPVRPATVVVNNTRIVNQTTVVNNLKQETVNIPGVGSRRTFVNEGPGLAPVEKATSRKIQPVPIATAMSQTRAPSGLPAAESGTARTGTRRPPEVSPPEPSQPSHPQKTEPSALPSAPPSSGQDLKGQPHEPGSAAPGAPPRKGFQKGRDREKQGRGHGHEGEGQGKPGT